jgi:hypothetical protein
LLFGRKANSTAVVLICISLTDDIFVVQIYTSRTPKKPSGCAIKSWLNLHKKFYPVSTAKIYELRSAFTIFSLIRDDTNPAALFEHLNKIWQKWLITTSYLHLKILTFVNIFCITLSQQCTKSFFEIQTTPRHGQESRHRVANSQKRRVTNS